MIADQTLREVFMKKTGKLTVSNGVSRLDGVRLAIEGEGDPFGAATNFIANRGLNNGEVIWVIGTDGVVGNVPVLFITDAGPVA
jgi:hypothetical protein